MKRWSSKEHPTACDHETMGSLDVVLATIPAHKYKAGAPYILLDEHFALGRLGLKLS